MGSGNDNITFDGGSVAGTTITGTDSADTLTFVGDLVDEVVFDSAIGSSAQISLGNKTTSLPSTTPSVLPPSTEDLVQTLSTSLTRLLPVAPSLAVPKPMSSKVKSPLVLVA